MTKRRPGAKVYRRLTAQETREVIDLYAWGEKTSVIAALYGVDLSYPQKVANRHGVPMRLSADHRRRLSESRTGWNRSRWLCKLTNAPRKGAQTKSLETDNERRDHESN